MSRERVIKTLNHFGLSKSDAEIYILLATSGPQNKLDITKALKISKKKLMASIKNLSTKGIILGSSDEPVILCAFPFGKALEILIRNEIESANEIRKKSNELFSNWFSSELKDKNIKKP